MIVDGTVLSALRTCNEYAPFVYDPYIYSMFLCANLNFRYIPRARKPQHIIEYLFFIHDYKIAKRYIWGLPIKKSDDP